MIMCILVLIQCMLVKCVRSKPAYFAEKLYKSMKVISQLYSWKVISWYSVVHIIIMYVFVYCGSDDHALQGLSRIANDSPRTSPNPNPTPIPYPNTNLGHPRTPDGNPGHVWRCITVSCFVIHDCSSPG